jgi:NADH-quinone oxidoreductase subunit C
MTDENASGTSKESAEPTGGAQSSAQRSGPDQAAQDAGGARPASGGDVEHAADPLGSDTSPEGGTRQAPARARAGMFGVHGSGDTSGFGGLRLPGYVPAPAERPYGGWFDAFVDELGAALAERGVAGGAVEQVTVDRGEITFYVERERVLDLCRTLRDDEALRFELCSSVSGVDYGPDVVRRLHVVYHLLSMTYRRRIRLEVSLDVDDAHVPSIVEVYPTADWHERETWDMFGVVFDGHPALTRILMPDDWDGHPQRKDYPLGGIPVEYKGAQIPPPDQRRAYS